MLDYSRDYYERLRPGSRASARERRYTYEDQLALIHPENYRRAHWSTRIAQLQQRLERFVTDDDQIVLVDDDNFGSAFNLSRPVVRFFERTGEYGGPPADSSAAIEELQRLKHEGATVLVIAWPAFWWTEYYSEFFSYLEANFRRGIDGEEYKVYELRC